MNVGAALVKAAEELRGVSESPRADAEILLAHLLDCSRAALLANDRDVLSAAIEQRFFGLVARRACGEPVAYLLGRKDFWSLTLDVNPHVLVPRPETELLVEWALELLPARGRIRVADLGTGSGAIALALAMERPDADLVATDVSEKALAVARDNARQLNVTSVRFCGGSWFEPLARLDDDGRTPPRFDLIVSNPPYVPEGDPHLDHLRFEPALALVAGDDGLTVLRHLIVAAPDHLRRDGWLLLEHGHDQGSAVRDLMRAAGYGSVATRRDLANQERVTGGQRR